MFLQVRFDASEIQGKEFTVSIATELDGKTITQVNVNQMGKQEKKEDKSDAHSIDLLSDSYLPSPDRSDSNFGDRKMSKNVPSNARENKVHKDTHKNKSVPMDGKETEKLLKDNETKSKFLEINAKTDNRRHSHAIADKKQDKKKADVLIYKKFSR